MKDSRHQTGRWGEQTAAQFLISKGYQIKNMNYSVQAGEIDLIAEIEDSAGSLLVFVEVKTRTSRRYGYPEEAITMKKWNRLMKAIDEYLFHHSGEGQDWRVDVIAIRKDEGTDLPEIMHFENVVMADEYQ